MPKRFRLGGPSVARHVALVQSKVTRGDARRLRRAKGVPSKPPSQDSSWLGLGSARERREASALGKRQQVRLPGLASPPRSAFSYAGRAA